jgi:cation diffusion facilitator family transporter
MEKFALKISAGGTLFFVVVGFVFAVMSHSEALLLDVVYSLTLLVLSIITLKVAHLVERPGNATFHFGYAHFEPLLNVLKSIILIFLCIFALMGAVEALIHGGREFEIEMALIYALISTPGCFAVALYLRSVASRSGSSLVRVEAAGWMVDALISAVVLATFGLSFMLKESTFAEYLPYVDPGLVVLLVIIIIPVPAKILKENMKEVLLFAPDKQLLDEIQQQIEQAVKHHDCNEVSVRVAKMGREIYLNVALRFRDDYPIANVSHLDKIREDIDSRMKNYNQNIVMDIGFIGDSKWANQVNLSNRQNSLRGGVNSGNY